ncbi:NAD(P)/FAD-dependent oxidoreductase [Cyanobium sp. WAJ14-Wanaka]|uniref:NAD(P)/FAD-dependent oxidoreductase n=1 Tax=Cyanobium sp. WAJ14-Wanaka TaxID=2823725 RepID=UPI0020CE5A87|nr:NAD(P)/FAD-dependent oxidoreductase [Cyanobium sp. WAJ14-Wanaka]MCP9775564.1 NAD(P)/FAD-dependent oxidoreductase [Cyanobium sp. WAJ14-Wanaka]
MLPTRAAVVVAGGGAAGFMAAIAAAEAGARDVHLLEATPEPLAKVRISGGGRCNVTHACWDPRVLVGHYPRGSQALRGPFSRFATGDAVAWFDDHGLELVEEGDGRMFPRSNRSESVIKTLRRAAQLAGVELHLGTALQTAVPIGAPGEGFELKLRCPGPDGSRSAAMQAGQLVLATGSHPSGRQLAAGLGHTLVAPVPSLFTLALAADPLRQLAGVAMDPVAMELELSADLATGDRAVGTKRFCQQGPVLITHWGLSGPATLRLTAFAARALKQVGYRAVLKLDWSGGRSQAQLEGWFAEARSHQAKRQLTNWRPWPELSRRLWGHLLVQVGADPERRWADLSKVHQIGLIQALRASRYEVTGRGPFGEEFVTAGGVPLAELSLATMESRISSGLYLAGELLDVDGITGGFNFQHCWSSGWLVGQAIAARQGYLI